jgi:hypothetical protein
MAVGGGPIQIRPASSTRRREVGVLGEETVAGVDGGPHPSGDGDLEDAVDVQVGFRGGRRADVVGDIRLADMGSGDVGVGVDGDGPHAETLRGADDAAGDFAAVGDEYLADSPGCCRD